VDGGWFGDSQRRSGRRRVLLGNVQVRTDTNVLVGGGEVVVQTVAAP